MGKRPAQKHPASEVAAEKERWERDTLAPFAREAPEGAAGTGGAPLGKGKRIYYSPDAEGLETPAKLGYPGEAPYTRGIYPTMYRGRLWTMRQYAGFGTAQETNQRFRHLLDAGQTGLSVAFDLPTQMGIDSDDARAVGEVG